MNKVINSLWITKGQDYVYAHDTPKLYTCLTRMVLSWLEPLKGSPRAHKGVARGVAIVIGISMSIAFGSRVEAVNRPYKDLEAIANYQLTDKQFNCHNEIVFKESSNNPKAINGSHYGYYQMRTKAVKTQDAYTQFYVYWYYVAKRYGFDNTYPDVPNYCKALAHLERKGWQ